jgi:hypothetical protein
MLVVVGCSDAADEDVPADSATPIVTLTNSPAPETLAPQDSILWRWGSVTVRLPKDHSVAISRETAGPWESPPDGGLVMRIRTSDSEVLIDADNGEVVNQIVADGSKGLFESLLQSVRVESSAGNANLGWPYTPDAPLRSKVQEGHIEYWEPDPSAGIDSGYICGIGVNSAGCFVRISNGKSRLAIDADTGQRIEQDTKMAAEDEVAFQRWSQAVEILKD